ncbi:probable prolyl 4-hydroxylase 11 [Brassica napus]|uniref:probable prolyl 4-hydroxylase 11 n=1 Tax=Brassica napus TaxID=3708 RepID=UPI002078AF4F|nr:probable prolyl 4-hydroxylase 11 [Brassica napus]
MSASASPSTISQYLKQRLHKLKIYGVSDLMQHIDTFKETMGDSVNVKIDGFNNLSILLCSLPPLLTALTCHMERVDASLRFPHERWPEVISMKPRAFLYHNFLCACSARTSTGSFISRGHDKIVEEIENRISEFTFLPVENGEGLRVIHYEVGQKFDPHFDGLGRIATFLMYLSDVDEGGETVFPMSSSGLSVSPKKGDAVLFWNNRPDGSQDPSSLHGER